jgi:hypothetical protein
MDGISFRPWFGDLAREGRVRPRPRRTPTDEGAAGRAGFAGCIGRDGFDPTRPLPVEQHAHIFGAIVISRTLATCWQVGCSTSTGLTTGQKLG